MFIFFRQVRARTVSSKVGHRRVEQGAALHDVAVLVLLDDHVLARQHVLHEQAGPLVVRVGVEHLPQATLGPDVIAAVLGEHREVQQRPDRRRRLLAAPLVERDRLVLLAHQVELIGELEERVRILGVGGDGLAERRDRRVAIIPGGLAHRLLVELGRLGLVTLDRRIGPDHHVKRIVRHQYLASDSEIGPRPAPARGPPIGHPGSDFPAPCLRSGIQCSARRSANSVKHEV
jgi:hypothetical protein